MKKVRKARMNPLTLHVDTERIISLGAADFELAPEAEKEEFENKRQSIGYWKDAWRRLSHNFVAMAALALLLLIILLSFLGPEFVPYKSDEQIRKSENLNPMQYSETELARIDAGEKVFPHFFGTDLHGRDLFVRTMKATQISLIIGVAASLIVLVIGTVYGSISGFAGGKVDFVMMRFVDIIYALPEMLVVLLLSSVLKHPIQNLLNGSSSAIARSLLMLGSGVISIFIVFGLLYWVGMSRIIRSQVLSIKNQEYITAARALGAKPSRIIRKHILPNCIGQIIVTTMLQIPSAIFLESFLSFLGLGVSAPVATLGSLCSEALGAMSVYPSRLIIPSILLSLIILCFNLFGDGLRDALDPRMKK